VAHSSSSTGTVLGRACADSSRPPVSQATVYTPRNCEHTHTYTLCDTTAVRCYVRIAHRHTHMDTDTYTQTLAIIIFIHTHNFEYHRIGTNTCFHCQGKVDSNTQQHSPHSRQRNGSIQVPTKLARKFFRHPSRTE
jgi:hypothetical protein